MLGRDLVTFIMKNNLLDTDVFDDGKLIGYISEEEAGAKFGVGATTVRVWVNQGRLNGLRINDTIYVPYDSEDPRLKEKSPSNLVKELAG